MAPTKNDSHIKILPRESIRAAIYILAEAEETLKARVWRAEQLPRLIDGAAHAQALLDDHALSWPLMVKCDSSVDRALYDLLQEARKWFSIQSEAAYSAIAHPNINRALQRVLTELPTFIDNDAEFDHRGIMRAKTDVDFHFKDGCAEASSPQGKYVDWDFRNRGPVHKFVESFDEQMIAAYWRSDNITTCASINQAAISEIPSVPQPTILTIHDTRSLEKTHGTARGNSLIADLTDDEETTSMYTPRARFASSPPNTERPPLNKRLSLSSQAIDTENVQVRYLAVLKTPNDNLSIELESSEGGNAELELLVEKFMCLHKSMKSQGCEHKFQLEELLGMARKMVGKDEEREEK